MAFVTWKKAVSGDWSDAADWSNDTVPTSTDEAEFLAPGNYTVTATSAETVSSLLFDAPGAEFVESAAGALDLNEFILDEGSVGLDGTNNINITEIGGGVLTLGAAGALDGGGDLDISGGELLATVNETLTNPLSMSGGFTIAAAPGTTLNLDGSAPLSIAGGTTVNFGAPGVSGVVIWHTPSGSSVGDETTVNVRGGVLKAGDANFSNLAEALITVSAGATIDLAGFSTGFFDLLGAGTVTTSVGSPTLTLEGGDFSGTIAGGLSLTVEFDTRLQGANTYTGDTTIDSAGELTLGPGGSITAASPIIIDDTGELVLQNSGPLTLANAISGDGFVVFDGVGTATINTANTYSSATVIEGGGAVAVGNGSALGSSDISLDSGELLATATETLTNQFVTQGSLSTAVTIAAASGKTLTMGSATGWSLASGVALDFGAVGETGTIVWFSPSGSVNGGAAVNVDDGTLKAGDGNLSDLLGSSVTTIASGATIDLGGFSTTIANPEGAGAIANSGGAATLTVDGDGGGLGFFAGTISGPIVLTIAGGVVLTGSDESTGAITIDSNDSLQLGNRFGSSTGSIAAGSVIDNGALVIVRNNAMTLASSISGSGSLVQTGSGVTTIDASNSYTGGTSIDGGTLAIGSAGALGSGEVQMGPGELEATATLSLANQLLVYNSSTIAAANGAAFTIGANGAWMTNSGSLTFGATGQDGTVLWSNAAGGTVSDPGGETIDIAAGTLKAADAGLNQLLSGSGAVTVAARATLDIAGFDTSINGLEGAGTVTDSGAAALLTLADASTFSGTLSGALSLVLDTNVEFDNNGAYDLTAPYAGVAPASGATGEFVVNNGLFEKTAGGGGVSVVSTPFTDNGEVAVTAGSINFTDGFSFAGVVEGVMSESGGVTTVSANAAGETTFFAGSGNDVIKVKKAPTYVGGGSGFDTLEIAANMTLAAGSIDNVAEIKIVGGVTTDLSRLFTGKANAIAGDIAGAGTLEFDGDARIAGAAFAFTVAHWSISGAGTDVTLGENLKYADAFHESAGTTLSLTGGHLLLSGGATFAGATVDGSQRLFAEGTTAVSGLTIGGTVVFENTKTVTQSGDVTIGDTSSSAALLINIAGATYKISNNSGIGRGAATGSHIDNAGLFEKTGGSGVSTILPAVQNNGTLEVTSGTLDLKGAISGTGDLTISGAAKLEADAAVASGQTASFIGKGGEFVFDDPKGFAGKISGFGATDKLDFGAPFTTGTHLSFRENSGDTQGVLTLAHGSTHQSFTLLGAYAPGDFHATSNASGTLVTFI